MENKNKKSKTTVINKQVSDLKHYNKSRKLWGTILGVIAFVLLIMGATYAWFVWSNTLDTTTGTGVFDIQYNNDTGSGAALSGTLSPADDKSGGLSTWVNINKTSTSVSGAVTLKLHITELSMGGTCSNTSYETKSECESASSTWTSADPNKFHFAVYTGGSCSDTSYTTPSTCENASSTWTATELVGLSGTLEGATSNSDIVLMSNVALTSVSTRYYIYLWLDVSAEDEYSGSSLSGYITASATQS